MDRNKVLVVDDEKDIRDVIEIYLMNEDIDVMTASDGLEALEKLESCKVDLIILDVMMPKLDGIRTCLKIREDKKLPSSFFQQKLKIVTRY